MELFLTVDDGLSALSRNARNWSFKIIFQKYSEIHEELRISMTIEAAMPKPINVEYFLFNSFLLP